MPKGMQSKLNKIMSTIAYKGFHTNMTCRGFSYKEGETYYEPNAKLCESGFHACLNPIDIFSHYCPGKSVFHEVLIDGITGESDGDTIVCGNKIKVLKEISLKEIAYLCLIHSQKNLDEVKHNEVYGVSVAGNRSLAISGDRGNSIVKYRGVAKAKNHSIAIAEDRSVARVENFGIAAARNYGVAIAGEYGSTIVADFGIAISESCGSSISGLGGASIAGNDGIAIAGPQGYAETGIFGIACCGDDGTAISEKKGISVSKGNSATGSNGLAVAKGLNVKVKGDIGAVLVIAKESDDGNMQIATAIVGQNGIEPNTWYKLNEEGKLVKDI